MSRIVVAYDVVSNKKRKKVSDILEGFGKRVNRSVFECELKNNKQRVELEQKLSEVIDKKSDSIRIYSICANCLSTSTVIGDEPKAFERDAVFFF